MLDAALFASLLLGALVTGVFWGSWLGLSRSIDTFSPEVVLAIGHQMIRNLAPVRPILMPAALFSMVAAASVADGAHPATCRLTVGGLALFGIALFITLTVKVPIDHQIRAWRLDTLPANWQRRRDRWERFHVLRTWASVCGLGLLIVATLAR